jgi:hypothetical protein
MNPMHGFSTIPGLVLDSFANSHLTKTAIKQEKELGAEGSSSLFPCYPAITLF